MMARCLGPEPGFEAMHDYTEAKSVRIKVDAKIPPGYPPRMTR